MAKQSIHRDTRVSFTLGMLVSMAVVILIYFYNQVEAKIGVVKKESEVQIREIEKENKTHKTVADERFYSLLEVIRVQQVHNGKILTSLDFMSSTINYHVRVDDRVKSPTDVLGIISNFEMMNSKTDAN